MLSGDLCKRSARRVELDQRARDARLGLERIERLLMPRAGAMISAQAKVHQHAYGGTLSSLKRCRQLDTTIPRAALRWVVRSPSLRGMSGDPLSGSFSSSCGPAARLCPASLQ